jgi:hypothetical protein
LQELEPLNFLFSMRKNLDYVVGVACGRSECPGRHQPGISSLIRSHKHSCRTCRLPRIPHILMNDNGLDQRSRMPKVRSCMTAFGPHRAAFWKTWCFELSWSIACQPASPFAIDSMLGEAWGPRISCTAFRPIRRHCQCAGPLMPASPVSTVAPTEYSGLVEENPLAQIAYKGT